MTVTAITSYDEFKTIVNDAISPPVSAMSNTESFVFFRSLDQQRKACRDRLLGNLVWSLQGHLPHFREDVRGHGGR